jgi:tetratricopeptide (TPR) repeat protein
MRERLYEEERPYTWIVYAAALLTIGGLGGYVVSISSQTTATAPAFSQVSSLTPGAAAAPATPMVDERALSAYRDILARDPKNVQAAVSAGNLLYDGRRYAEAIPFYQQAHTLNPSDVNVSTDLGTALWYSGRPDEALGQYARSLAANPDHAQTLFNLGIVKSEGKADYKGAVAAWERLLAKNPGYSNAGRVRNMIAEAAAKIRAAN